MPKSREARPNTRGSRGKKPRWLAVQLKSRKQIDDFRIDLATAQGAEWAFFFCAQPAAISWPVLLS